jgi:Tetratricopeptide repeat
LSSRHGRGIGPFSSHASSIFQLLATALAASLVPGAKTAWTQWLHRPLPQWIDNVFVPSIATVIFAALVLLLSRPRGPLGRLFEKTLRPKGDRIAIYVSRFGGDDLSETVHDRIIASIQDVLGPAVEVLPEKNDWSRGVASPGAAEQVRRDARKLLNKNRGDLLIWGKVVAMPGKETEVDLRFVSAEHDWSRRGTFGFTESSYVLKADFVPEMGSALAAVAGALAMPAVRDQGTFVAQTLTGVANKLAVLIRGIPTSIREGDRAFILVSYGLIEETIGSQSGQLEPLNRAVAAHREVLKEYIRERVPLGWAMTQNNLGNALSALGQRESGTGRLEEAIAAYREALKENTRERVPLSWAMTQNNLGNALSALGQRESGTRVRSHNQICRAK